MEYDLTEILDKWDFESGKVSARTIRGADGREKLQFRLDCGILQMEGVGRPDGRRPGGHESVLHQLRAIDARSAGKGGRPIELTDEQWGEIDRELMQYYHRRIGWLAVREYRAAIRDADHNLDLMDFAREHSSDEARVAGHEQYRPFVLLHRTQAAAQIRLSNDDPEGAIEEIKAGADRIRAAVEAAEGPEAVEKDQHHATLREMAKEIREKYDIKRTLKEELDDAVAAQDYGAPPRSATGYGTATGKGRTEKMSNEQ